MNDRPRSWATVAVIVAMACVYAPRAFAQDHAVAGRNTTCVVSAKNALTCVGSSVGKGATIVPPNTPVVPTGMDVASAVALSIFTNYVCAINSDSAVWCWSSDGISQPFRIQTPTTPGLPLLHAKSIAVGTAIVPGSWDACALLPASFGIGCWQFEAHGVTAVNLTEIKDVTGEVLYGFEQVSVGYGFGCAVRGADKAVVCWGLNDAGQLGRGIVTQGNAMLPAFVVPGVKATMVSVGYNHACALSEDGRVLCWGADEYGQLGNGQSNLATNFPFPSPQAVKGISNATNVSAGYMFSCAALADASVKCWGQNEHQKLGSPKASKLTFSSTPLSVNLGPGKPLNYVVVSAGRDHACASGPYGGLHLPPGNVTPSGLFVKCWGSNLSGQIIH